MNEPSDHFKDLTFFLDRYGITAATAIFLGWIVTHQLRDMKKQLDRCVHNERVIMTKLGIPFTLDPDGEGK